MDPLVQSFIALLTAMLSIVSRGARRARQRSAVHEDLKLLGELEKHVAFGEESESRKELMALIQRDIEALSHPPVRRDWGTVFVFLAFVVGLGYWTGDTISHAHHGIPWYGWATGLLAGFFLIGLIGFVQETANPSGKSKEKSAL